MAEKSKIKIISEKVEQIRPLLAGLEPPIQGAILADLLAIWLAGHFAEGPPSTTALRDLLLEQHMGLVRALIPINEKAILEARERNG